MVTLKGLEVMFGSVLISVKIKLFPSLDLVRAYPGMLVSSAGVPMIPPTAVSRV